jgi:hypothetical protein
MKRRHVSKIRAAPLPGDDGVAAFASVDLADRRLDRDRCGDGSRGHSDSENDSAPRRICVRPG